MGQKLCERTKLFGRYTELPNVLRIQNLTQFNSRIDNSLLRILHPENYNILFSGYDEAYYPSRVCFFNIS